VTTLSTIAQWRIFELSFNYLILIIIDFNHKIGYTAAPAVAAAAAAAAVVAAAPGHSSSCGGRSVLRLPSLTADVTRCGLRRTQPGDQK